MVAGFSVFVFLCPFHHHAPWLSVSKAPHCVIFLCPSHTTLFSCFLPESPTSHTCSLLCIQAIPCCQKMPTSAKREGCFRRKGDPPPTLRGSCAVSTWSLGSVPAVQPRAETHQTSHPWCEMGQIGALAVG